MGAPATHRPWPQDGRAAADVLGGADVLGADVLGGGDDDAPPRRAALWTAAAVVVGAVLVGSQAVDGTPEAADPPLALRDGELVPRDRTVGARLAEAAVHVEVVNPSDRTVDLGAAALVPGAWEVDVVDRTLVRPGESVVLSLHRTVVCDERASYGPTPEHLVLEARTADDEQVVVRLPVAHPSAYGGQLDDALRDPGRACVVTGVVSGPIGDLVASWRARRAWPPVPSR